MNYRLFQQFYTWYYFDYCPTGSFAIGFSLRIDLSTSDKTYLNAIKLFCNDASKSQITSYNGLWGDWTNITYCPNNKRLNGFRFLYDYYYDPYFLYDDTGIGALRMYCENTSQELVSSFEGSGTNWKGPIYCPINQFICALSVQFQPFQGYYDDIALYNFKFMCCT